MEPKKLIWTVEAVDGDKALRELLFARLRLSHSLLVKLKQQHKISVNGMVTHTNYQVQSGDLIAVDLDLDEQSDILPEAVPLQIVFEDEDLLIVDKPAGLPVHPSRRHQSGTLANAVMHYWQQSGWNALFRPINRLDKDTSGLVMIGKNQFAHQAISCQQRLHGVERRYLALVEGVVTSDRGHIEAGIARQEDRSRKRMVSPSGQSAATNYQIMERYQQHTLLQISPETGRTHQIRVHLSFAGYPICGDELYGRSSSLISRQALHACELTFVHPRTGSAVSLAAPIPEDIRAALIALR